ncbi:MAG TPA: N-acetyltransferase [Burkholderiaceae bacterium]|jgi:L-amino acid N-acyltransferase YncA
MLTIRRAEAQDFEQIWPILQAIAASGEVFAWPRDVGPEMARQLWMQAPQQLTCVAEQDGRILGSYYVKPNQLGGGAHVCNAGYAVAEAARGQGLAAAMCEHSQALARELGFTAMQFNFVVSSNEAAVHLWTRLGFATVGRLPGAFDHPRLGWVDALVMFKRLQMQL